MAAMSFFIISLTVLLLSTATCIANDNSPAKHISFTCSLAPNIPAVQRLEGYYRDAFANLGYTFEMHERPSKRAIAEAAAGTSDGECARVQGALAAEYRDTLLPVNVIIGRTTINIWSRQQEPLTVADLGKPQYIIGYVDGSEASRKILEQLTANLGDQAPKFIAINNHKTALRMLTAGRLTHCIGAKFTYEAAAINTGLTNKVFDSGTIYTAQATPLLNIKHRDLLEPFTRELHAIIDEHKAIGDH